MQLGYIPLQLEEHALRRITVSERKEEAGNITQLIKSPRMRWAGRVELTKLNN
jgi:hypothetical protein